MNTPAWIAKAHAVIKTDDSSQTANASRLMPAEQRAAAPQSARRPATSRRHARVLPLLVSRAV
jgi:hypothetical protein